MSNLDNAAHHAPVDSSKSGNCEPATDITNMALTNEDKVHVKIAGFLMAIAVLLYIVLLLGPPALRALKPVFIGDKPAGREDWRK